MKRLTFITCLAAACVLAQPQPAAAGFWDWLEEFSGPGPFTGFTLLGTECWKDKVLQHSPIASEGVEANAPIPTLRCLFLDLSRFHADQDPDQGYPALSVWLTDFGGSLRIADGLDIGAGIGVMAFGGDTVPDAKLVLSPIRIVARPIVLATPRSSRRDWQGFFNIYWKQTFVPGDLTGDEFGQVPPPGTPKFSLKGGELLGSFGVAIDVTSLIPLFRR